MDPQETGCGYDTIANRWLEPKIQTNGILQVERATQFATTRQFALDIGCGCSGRFADLLMQRGYAVDGIDVSKKMIALAKERQPGVEYFNADIAAWPFPKKYDFVLAWDSIWHLPLGQQELLMRKICDGLSGGGVFVFTFGGLDTPTEKADAFMGPPMEYSTLGIPRTMLVLAEGGCICRHLEYDQYPEPHVYVIAQKI